MKTSKEWAEYYRSMGIWVFPSNQIGFSWHDWRGKSKETYEKEFEQYNWEEAKKLQMVAGGTKRKAIFVINGLRDKKLNYVNSLLRPALSELGLPSDYPWVIWNNGVLGIIVDIYPDVQGNAFDIYNKRISIIWEKAFTIPSVDSKAEFWQGKRPETKPVQVDSSLLTKVAKSFYEKHIKPIVREGKKSPYSFDKDTSKIRALFKWFSNHLCKLCVCALVLFLCGYGIWYYFLYKEYKHYVETAPRYFIDSNTAIDELDLSFQPWLKKGNCYVYNEAKELLILPCNNPSWPDSLRYSGKPYFQVGFKVKDLSKMSLSDKIKQFRIWEELGGVASYSSFNPYIRNAVYNYVNYGTTYTVIRSDSYPEERIGND